MIEKQFDSLSAQTGLNLCNQSALPLQHLNASVRNTVKSHQHMTVYQQI